MHSSLISARATDYGEVGDEGKSISPLLLRLAFEFPIHPFTKQKKKEQNKAKKKKKVKATTQEIMKKTCRGTEHSTTPKQKAQVNTPTDQQ